MQAMELRAPRTALELLEKPVPQPARGEILAEVLACGVCRTDLHIVDGDISDHLPIVPGHEVVGRILALGEGVQGLNVGDRIGVPWLGHACGHCPYCRSGHENLCDTPVFTGFTRDGGFATHIVADAAFCFPIPDVFDDAHAAPLLCAGLIGYRALRLAGEGRRLGLYGFGAAAHILAQIAAWQGREVYGFTREGDAEGQAFALSLGCVWAGPSTEPPPEELDAAILFAPVGALVPQALRAVRKGGRVVCGGIHMSDIPSFPYEELWGERAILSVANLTREDGRELLAIAAEVPVRTHITCFALEEANAALDRLRRGELEGAAVLLPNGPH
ncbi:MAG TPA: zinc-dependent alcohol dehydrogenase family protein [Sphingomonas sp.]|nr:zinc-dependent alcohol dehydrogenase family protein [Sphingomonas sp.]